MDTHDSRKRLPPGDATGNHHARRAAAKVEPSPITGLRDMLATALAADIAAVTPVVCDILRESIPPEASANRRGLILAAHRALMSEPGALAMGVAQQFRARFDAKLKVAVDRGAAAPRAPLSSLALLEDPLLALDLAINQCAARLREQASADVFQLTARVAAMLGKADLDDTANPVLPRVLVAALADALAGLGFVAEQCLDVLKGFGPPLLHIAPDLYAHANELLAERGVLADFNAKYGRPTASRAPAPSRERAIEDEVALAAILERLLSGHRALAASTTQLRNGH